MTKKKETPKKRGTYLGGPDAAAICKVHPFYQPIEVAARLRNEALPLEENWNMKVGKVLEPVIVEDYERRHGVRVVERNVFRSHPDWPWSGSHIDGLIRASKQARRMVLEAKTTFMDIGWGVEHTDEVPEYVLVQVAFYLPIWDADSADVVVLIKNRELREYHITRDQELERMVYEQCDEFWQRVMVRGELPDLDGSDATHAYLARRYPRDQGNMLIADPASEALIAGLRDAKGALALNAAHASMLEAQLKALIGENAGIESPYGKITWRNRKPSVKVDWEGVALDMKPLDEPRYDQSISLHTTEKPGARVFNVPRGWPKTKKEEDDE